MATDREATAMIDTGDDGDFTPPREAFHTDPQLCKDMLRSVVSTYPLEIQSSQICSGSGLFAGADIEPGREIYRSAPLMSTIDSGNESFCHYCLKDTGDNKFFRAGSTDASSPPKACTGCRVARFCSKKCQKAAWVEFHKDECGILAKVPKMKAQHLLAHRLIFWQQRKFITTLQGKAISFLETHFYEYNKDRDRGTELMDIAEAVRQATGGKVNLGLAWRIVPSLRINCVMVRPAASKLRVGYALDLVTAAINHSCNPNAFVFFEGRQLRVRSLKKIAAGEEITLCYVDPAIEVASRKKVLQRDYFFHCSCSGCKSDIQQELSLLGSSSKLPTLHQAQRDILDLFHSAVLASSYPGIHPTFENLAAVETQLRTITARALPPTSPTSTSSWPDDMRPLPRALVSLGMLCYARRNPIPALRNMLRGTLAGRQKGVGIAGPEWVNNMVDTVAVLLLAGFMPTGVEAFASGNGKGQGLPSLEDIRMVTFGYFYETCREAGKVFGDDSEYTKLLGNAFAMMMANRPVARPGSKAFAEAFAAAQGRVLAWVGVAKEYELILG